MKFLLHVLLLVAGGSAAAQHPVTWTFKAIPARGGYTVLSTAKLQPGWHLYAQRQLTNAIALPTQISFRKNPLLQFPGSVKEIRTLQAVRDETLGVEANQYSDEVSFQQRGVRKGKAKTLVAGTTNYQLCTDEKCLPPKTVSFSIPLD